MVRPSRDQLREDSNLVHIDLDKLCAEYRRRAHDYVRKHYPDVSADDVAQETMLRLWEMRSRIDGNRRPNALVFEIASNVARDVRRRRRSESNAPPDAAHPPVARSPEEHAMDKLDGDLAWQALNELQPSDRDLVLIRDVKGVSFRAVSEREKISVVAVRQRLCRARSRMRCNFHRLSRILIPLGAGVELVRWFRRHAQSASLVGAAGVVAVSVVASVGIGDLLPGQSQEANGGIPQPTVPFAATSAPRIDEPTADTKPRAVSPAPSSSEVEADTRDPSEPDDSSLPLQSNLELSPGTGEGRKQENVAEIETPIGPVGTDGASYATGPASATTACSDQIDAACFLTRPTTMDGRHLP